MIAWDWQTSCIVLCFVILIVCFLSILWGEHKSIRDQYSKFDARVGKDCYSFKKGVHRP